MKGGWLLAGLEVCGGGGDGGGRLMQHLLPSHYVWTNIKVLKICWLGLLLSEKRWKRPKNPLEKPFINRAVTTEKGNNQAMMSQKVMLGKTVLKTRLVCLVLNSKQVTLMNHLLIIWFVLNQDWKRYLLVLIYYLPRCCGLDDFE